MLLRFRQRGTKGFRQIDGNEGTHGLLRDTD
jgi:hypothetical protein